MIAKADKYPLRAIRSHCLSCAGGSSVYVRFCTNHGASGGGTRCDLWPFRFGKKPAAAKRQLGSAGQILLTPERMPPPDVPLEECSRWLEEALAQMAGRDEQPAKQPREPSVVAVD